MTALSQAFTLSRQVAIARIPVALTSLLALQNEPAEEDIWTALEADLGFIRMRARTRGPITQELMDWAGLLRWLWDEVETFSARSPYAIGRLTALAAMGQWMETTGDLWEELARVATPSQEFTAGLRALVNSRRLEMGLPADAPEWYRPLIAAFTDADARQAWDEVDIQQQAIFDRIEPSLELSTACRALSRLDAPSLVTATAAAPDLCTAYSMVCDLSVDAAVELAASTPNDRIRFVCTLHITANRTTVLSRAQEIRFADALLSVASVPGKWRVWMKTCFTYPVRFAQLHRSLGMALAKVGQPDRQTYIDVLDLADSAGSRELTTQCLAEFASAAPLSDRQAFWTAAYRKWVDWDLGPAAELGMTASVLDFAIVGHMIEGLTLKDRRDARRAARQKVREVETEWHHDIGDFRHQRYVAASRLKPLTWAGVVVRGTGIDWLERLPLEMPRRYRADYWKLRR